MKRLVHALDRAYMRRIIAVEAASQGSTGINERPVELRFLFQCVTRLHPRTVLDVGTGTSPLPALLENCGLLVTAIDNIHDYWPDGMFNHHWMINDDDITLRRDRGIFDLVTCISVLEHIAEPVHAMRSMSDALAPGGHLILTTPYNETRHVPDVYQLPGAAISGPLPYICRSSSRVDVADWCEASNLEIVEQEYWRLWTGDVWRQGEWTKPALVEMDEPHQLTCLLLRRPCTESS